MEKSPDFDTEFLDKRFLYGIQYLVYLVVGQSPFEGLEEHTERIGVLGVAGIVELVYHRRTCDKILGVRVERMEEVVLVETLGVVE